MKRLIVSCAVMASIIFGAAAPAAAKSDNAAVITHECEGGTGHGTVMVRGEMKSTQTVPAEQSQGRGPFQPPPGQGR